MPQTNISQIPLHGARHLFEFLEKLLLSHSGVKKSVQMSNLGELLHDSV